MAKSILSNALLLFVIWALCYRLDSEQTDQLLVMHVKYLHQPDLIARVTFTFVVEQKYQQRNNNKNNNKNKNGRTNDGFCVIN